ncbi:MAG: MASE1 domain-containing protein [Lysobacter sp.]|nr:MASE1 domain-containing protein [Lysobacter sp.]
MGKTWGRFIAKGIAIAVLYGLAYLALRYISFNQWFLPAGLRAACLLFLPLRYWPFIILGDASAVLYQRVPKLDQYDAMWVYAGPFLLISSVAIAPYLARIRVKGSQSMHYWMPLVAMLIAIWAAVCTSVLNYALGGPRQPDGIRNFVDYVTGNYLGILMFVLPVLMWRTQIWKAYQARGILRDTMIACAFLMPLFLFVKSQPESKELPHQVALMLMMIPAAFLTLAHGWHGAAAGVLLVNLSIAQTMEYAGIPKYYDDTVFISHIGLCIAAMVFLLFGRRITLHFENARRLGASERDALNLARMSLLFNEPVLRDQLLCMAQLQVLMDDERAHLYQALRANGKHHEALNLNNRGVELRQFFEEQALVLYPIGIERSGLFGVLDTATFRESRASGAEVELVFGRTDPRALSSDLQVLAYRCLCHAIDHLSDWEPAHYRLSLRVWRARERRGIYVAVSIVTVYDRQATPYGESALLLLEARVKASGGRLRKEPHCIRLLLSESHDEPVAIQVPPQEQ